MVLKVVAGLKNRELVMAGVVGGDCRDKMAVLEHIVMMCLSAAFCLSTGNTMVIKLQCTSRGLAIIHTCYFLQPSSVSLCFSMVS